MLQSLGEASILLVPVNDVHFQWETHVVQGVLGAAVVLVAPMEVEALDLVLIVQGSPEDVRQAETFLLLFG